MARTNYSFEKRQKEAARKKKQEEKRKRRQERGAGDAPIGEEGAPQGGLRTPRRTANPPRAPRSPAARSSPRGLHRGARRREAAELAGEAPIGVVDPATDQVDEPHAFAEQTGQRELESARRPPVGDSIEDRRQPWMILEAESPDRGDERPLVPQGELRPGAQHPPALAPVGEEAAAARAEEKDAAVPGHEAPIADRHSEHPLERFRQVIAFAEILACGVEPAPAEIVRRIARQRRRRSPARCHQSPKASRRNESPSPLSQYPPLSRLGSGRQAKLQSPSRHTPRSLPAGISNRQELPARV